MALFVITLAAFTLTTSTLSAQSWYDANWSFRRAITITNPGSSILTDYQIKTTLNSSFNYSAANSDGSDIRITLDDGTTEIPFWIEEWNFGTDAIIWVKMPSISTSGTTIYMYYGNPGAASVSDGPSTFRLFEDFETWNPAGITGWTEKALLPNSIADQTAAVYNGKMYSMGGYINGPNNPQNKNFEYDPSTNAWTVLTPMPTSRWGMVAVEFNGKIYVFGGTNTYYNLPGINKNEVYDPVTNTWDITKNNVPVGLDGQGIMGVKYGDKIHLFLFGHHYEYDPANDTYTQKAGMPTPRNWSTCATVGSKIYLIGGDSPNISGSNPTNVNEVYDPATDTWETKRVMPNFVWGATRENPVINGKIYVVNGMDGINFYNSNFIYDPVSNSWEAKSSASHARDGIACAVISDKLYVVGGRADFIGPYGLPYTEVYDPMADLPPYFNLWSTSGSNFVYADASAKFKGNYGLVIKQDPNQPIERFLQSNEGFGNNYALDFEWNISNAGGLGSEPRPQGLVTLSETDPDGSLFFYNENSVPVVRWNYGSFHHLQNSTWNNWHKVTVVRNGLNSGATFDNNPYYFWPSFLGGSGQFRFGVYFKTKQYIDNVRVRKYQGVDPSTSVGTEQHLAPPEAPILVSPANGSTGVFSSPTFVWNASPTATSYHFQISVVPGFQFVYDLSGITTTTATISGLTNNTTYYWRVNASNERDAGNWSTVWSFTTCANPPTISAGPDRSVCADGLPITMTGYSFTNATGASWSGGSGSWNGNIYTPVPADFIAGTVTMTYTTNTASPCGDVSDQMNLTFIAVPSVTWTTILEGQCASGNTYSLTGGTPGGGIYSGAGVTGSNFNASVAGIGSHILTYTYTNPTTLCSGSVTNTIVVNQLPTVVAGTYGPVCKNTGVLSLSGSPAGGIWSGIGVSGNQQTGYVFDPLSGTQTLTYTYSDNNSCVNSNQTVITVNDQPVLSAGSYGPVCLNSADVSLAGSPAGGIWSGNGVSGSQQNGYVFHPSAGTQTLTYSYTNINSCANSVQVVITVHELPVVNAGTYESVCNNAADITLGGTPSGGIWSGNGVSGNQQTGFVFDASAGTQTLTYSYSDANSCTVSAHVTITIFDLPVVTTGTYGPVCIDAANIALTGSPAGGIWTGAGVFGSQGSGYIFNPSSGTQTLTYTYVGGNSCANSAQTVVNVNQLPVVSAGTYGPICRDAADVSLAGSPAGGIWSGTGVSGNQQNGYVFDPSTGTQTLSYSYTNGNSCANTATTIVTVHDLPVVSTGTYGPVCENAPDIQLSGTPIGGSFSGIGVTGNLFDPSLGSQTITYSYSDLNGCANIASTLITVNPLPVVSAGTYAPVSVGSGSFSLTGSPLGGVFSGTGVITGNQFDPLVAGTGVHTITYTYSDINGCANSASTDITVFENTKTLTLKVFLQGLYIGNGSMSEAKNELGLPRWGNNIADEVTIELHDATSYSTIIHTFSNVNLSTSGLATVTVPSGLNSSYYITVKHRNSIQTTSYQPISFAGSNLAYDFDGPLKAYGGNMLMMIDGRWVMFGGDTNQDGNIDTGDMSPIDNDSFGYQVGYLVSDINGDASIDTGDMTIVDNNAANYVSSIHP